MKNPTRREVIGGIGALPFLSVASSSSQAKSESGSHLFDGSALVKESDRREYTRLKTLDLEDAKANPEQKKMPVGKIGDLQLGRLICGSNLISMNMHARDLDYVSELATHYNTEERVLMTMKKCEEHGINSIVLKNHNFKQFKLSKYWDEWGGKMKWIADVITTDIDKYEALLVEHIELGASAAYLWGGASDIWYNENKQGNIIKAFEIMKRYDMPVGIGAHRLEPVKFCEKEGIVPDFYFATLHHDNYWSAHPEENRRFMEMYLKESDNHEEYHDNMFCHKHEETIEFMRNVKVPWIAFKVLAAGAIPPEDGIRFAFENGVDFICLGFFDFQITQDVMITRKAIVDSKDRKRPWSA